MDFFDLLKHDGITTSTHLGCSYDIRKGQFSVGPIGLQGCEGPYGSVGPVGPHGCCGSESKPKSEEELELERQQLELRRQAKALREKEDELRQKSQIPGVCLYVKFTEEAARKYFELMVQSLPCQQDRGIQVIRREPSSKLVLKDEFKQAYAECQQRRSAVTQKIDEQLAKLSEMGCDVEDYHINYPRESDFQSDWFQSVLDYSSCYLEVRCHQHTDVYKRLQEMKIVT
jgi:hypothetical protein